jgi:hypothetical protein
MTGDTFTAGATAGTFTVTATSGAVQGTTGVTVTQTAATVAGRYVFYNGSSYDGLDPAASAADDGAIAPDKSALLPGQTATFANYTSYSRGINGLMIDVAELPAGPLTADDFTFKVGNDDDPAAWAAGPAPADISVRRGAGADGSDRITILWADGDVKNQWLQITINATANTGLGLPDVFYFGNLAADTGNNPSAAAVTIADIGLARSLNGQPAAITSPADFNRSGQITIADVGLAQANNGQSIALISVPAAAAPPAASLAAATSDPAGATAPTARAPRFSIMLIPPAANRINWAQPKKSDLFT